MKRNKLLLFILLLLLAAVAYFYFTQRSSTLSEELSDFAVADTAAIDKIFLADKQNNSITLTRVSADQWMLNGKEPARQSAVELLLATMKEIEVRSPVGRFTFNQIIKQLASNGVKVEIYQHGELVKTYYVGGSTQDHLGTYMYLENSTVPFVMHIPGFNGFLTPRYFTNYHNWKERYVFKYPKGSIAEVKVTDKEFVDGTFAIKYNNEQNRYELYDAAGKVISQAMPDRISAYLDFYNELSYEGVAEKLDRRKADSLAVAGSFLYIDVKDRNGKTKHVEFIRKPVDRRTLSEFDKEGNPPKYDLDRMLTRIDNDTALVTTQYGLFEKLFLKTEQFYAVQPVKSN